MRNVKRFVALFAAACMAVTGIPVNASAAETESISAETSDYAYLEGYTKAWGDEFDGETLGSDWNVEKHAPGWVNEEWQEYVDSSENIKVEDGRLKLIPVRKKVEHEAVTELLVNNDFSKELTGWTETIANWGAPAWKADASHAFEENAIVYTIDNPGEDVWHIQLKQPIKLKKDNTYKVSYKITSSIDRVIANGIQHNGGAVEEGGDGTDSWKGYGAGASTFEAGKEQLVEYSFKADADDEYVSFYVSMGQLIAQPSEDVYAKHTVKISDVSIKEMPNMIKNGNFVDGTNEWMNVSLDTTAAAVSDNKIVYSIASAEGTSKNSWDNQLFQTVSLEKDAKYTLTFKAKSSIDRSISSGLQHYNDAEENGYEPNYQHKVEKIALTAGVEKDIQIDVDMTGKNSDEHANVLVQMGSYGNDWDDPKEVYGEHEIELSNFNLVKTYAAPIETDEYTYTSGRVNTQDKKTFKYGLFEAKATVPAGMGYLPAFWLMPNSEETYGQWPRCGEIDCMEVMGQDTKKAYGTIHYGNPHSQNQGTYVTKGDFATEDHVYACEWLPGKIVWYVDGQKYYETSDWYSTTEGQGTVAYPAPFDQEFYVILNLAIGGSWVGYPDENTQYGEDKAFSIDYVRVYQKSEYDEDVERPIQEITSLREPDENGNYVINGDFAVKEDLVEEKDWVFKTALGGEATAEIKDNAIDIKTTNAGTVDYSVQLYQAEIPLEKGATYEVSFKAKSNKPRTMNVDVKAPDRGYKNYLGSSFQPEVTEEIKEFKTEFVMGDETDTNGRLEFNMGNAGTEEIVISDVALKKIAGPEDETDDEKKTVLADGNYVYNGKFQEGKNYLGYWDITMGSATSAKVTDLKDNRRLEIKMPEEATTPFVVGQKDLALASGKNYLVSFKAEASKEARLDVQIGGRNKTVTLEAKNKEYSFEIPATARLTNSDISLTVIGNDVTVKLDDISITENAILKNGNFNAGWTGFSDFINAPAKMTKGIDSITAGNDNTAEFTIDNTGKDDWNIQLIQYIKLEKGKKYRLSYDAKSTIDRDIHVQIQHDPDNHKLGDKTDYENYAGTSPVAITNEWKTFVNEFDMTGDTNPYAKFNICMGAVNGRQITEQHKVLIDNISVEEISGGSSEDPVADESMICAIPDMVYTGSRVNPVVKIYDGDKLLTLKKDYTVKYFNNIDVNATRKLDDGMGEGFNAEIPYAEITFKGDYTGVQKVNFNIIHYAIGDTNHNATAGTVLTAIDQLSKSTKDQVVFKSLKANKKTLKAGKDFTVSLIAADGTVVENAKAPKNVTGVYTLKVAGKGNYTGTIATKIIVADSSMLLKNASVVIGRSAKNVTYTGKAIALKPGYYDSKTRKVYEVIDDKGTVSGNACNAADVFVVKCGGKSLVYGKDYTVSYRDNKAVGKAVLEIKGAGEYVGSKSVNFNIKGIPFNASNIAITGIEPVVSYTGSAIKVKARLGYKKDDKVKPLYSGSDYTVSYKNNVNKGKATVTFTGKAAAGFTGSIKKTFTIKPVDISKDVTNETVSGNVVVFKKAGAKLPGNLVALKNGDAVLVEGRDFIVKKCINNRKLASYTDSNAPTATISGKGNYVGKFDVTYTIVAEDINNTSMVATPVAYKANATKDYKPAIAIKDAGKALKAGVDYTVEYVNCKPEEVKAYVEKTSTAAPYAVVSGNSLKGYEGTKNVPLQIYLNKLASNNTVVVVAPAVYTGSQVTPSVKVYFSKDRSVVNAAKKAIADGKAETLDTMEGLTKIDAANYSVSYGANVKAGKNRGSVTVKGISYEYGSSVTVKFNITEKAAK